MAELERFASGRHFHAYRILGAHVVNTPERSGTRFAVWAPQARGVRLLGGFNGWDGTRHAMHKRGDTGVWELFVPGVGPGELYKYAIVSNSGQTGDKADPYGFAMELRPNTASRVWDLARHDWDDGQWIRDRSRRQQPDRPISIYEVHLGSWRRKSDASSGARRWLSYDEMADELVPYVRDMGFTHLELLPITEHPYDPSWGYQTVGYFAPTSRFGDPDACKRFIDSAHQAGLGVILDWVPAHFPKDGHGLVYFDGTHLYEHADPSRGHHPDWGTYVFDYGRPQVVSFLISSAMFWVEEYHIDGLRVDAVASMLYLDYSRAEGQWKPNRYGGRENLEAIEFVKRFNYELHDKHPDVLTIAEESTTWPGVTQVIQDGGLGFDYKWNMGWMNDTLEHMRLDPLFRSQNHKKLSFSIHYAFSERFLLPLSHDEVVHGKSSLLGKMPGDREARLANLRLLLTMMYAHPGKKLLFMGSEIGPWQEWSEAGELPWDFLEAEEHAGLRRLVQSLNELYRREPALHEVEERSDGFAWIDFEDAARSVLSFVRWARERREAIVAVGNYTPMRWQNLRLHLPQSGTFEVLLNSDDAMFGGQGTTYSALDTRHDGSQDFIELQPPPLGALLLKKRAGDNAA